MAKSRLLYRDIAKGIGIILVVCSHTTAHDLMIWAVGFFVPIFYFYSGYMTTYSSSKDSIAQKMKKREFFALVGKHSLTIFCIEILFIRESSIAYCKLTNADEVGILGGICGVIIALFGGTVLSVLLHKNKFLRRVLFGEKNVITNKTAETQ